MKDLTGSVTKVAKMGYDGVEFYSPYMSWSADQAKDVRKLLDDLGIKCFSTHNGRDSFEGDRAKKAIELNTIIAASSSSWPAPAASRFGRLEEGCRNAHLRRRDVQARWYPRRVSQPSD